MAILYLCNRKKCEDCQYPECKHTTDVNYAANFVKETVFDTDKDYWEEGAISSYFIERDDGEDGL